MNEIITLALHRQMVMPISLVPMLSRQSNQLQTSRFVSQTANNFPEFLYILIFQIEYKILLHTSDLDMDSPPVDRDKDGSQHKHVYHNISDNPTIVKRSCILCDYIEPIVTCTNLGLN